jgi:hypothetical protein
MVHSPIALAGNLSTFRIASRLQSEVWGHLVSVEMSPSTECYS